MRLLPARREVRQATVSSPVRSRNGNSTVVASAQKITRENDELVRRLIQAWQTRALTYFDQCGELKFAAEFYARMLMPLQLYAAEKIVSPDGTIEIKPTKNQAVIAQLERIQDPGGGRIGLLGQYGRLKFLTGEGYLLCSLDADGIEQWEILSTDELRIQGRTYLRYNSPTLPVQEYREAESPEGLQQGEAVAIRIWQRHPRWSALANSTVFGILDIVEELLLLTRAVRARAVSRLAGSGILFIDDRISPKPLEPIGDEDPLNDPFMAQIIEAAQAAISDPGSGSAVSPLIVRVPVPDGQKLADLVYHLQVMDPTQFYPEEGLRMECIRRMAIGLDMPPEVLLGTADTNHWNAWLTDETTWKSHGQPQAQQFCDDISSSFLRPTLRELRVADWQKYCIAYDATAVINHPSRATDAKDLYDRRAISKAALREANAFDEQDAPSETELWEMLGVAVRDGSLALFGTPSVRGGTIETGPGTIEKAAPGGDTVAPGSEPSAVKPGPPPMPSEDTQPVATLGSLAAARILGVSESALWRAREVAGSRIRSQANRDKDVKAAIKDVAANKVAATLGREKVRALGCPPDEELVAGVKNHIAETIRSCGLNGDAADRLAQMIERHAAATLYEDAPRPFPPPFSSYIGGIAAGNGKP